LNNPLKYTDPSGFSDVAVTTEALPPEVIEYAKLLGVDIDTRYTVTIVSGTGAGTQITGLGNSADITNIAGEESLPLPKAAYDLAEKMRVMEGDDELNIGWNCSDLIVINHFANYEGGRPTLTAQYYINSRGRLELITSSPYDNPISWKNLLRYTTGAFLESVGLITMTIGIGVSIAAFTPNPVIGFGGLVWGVDMGIYITGVGGGLFSLGVYLLTEEQIYIPIPY
jgi:hypothetical protein